MFKFIIIVLVVLFLFGRIVKWLLKYALIGFVQQQQYNQTKQNKNNFNKNEPIKNKDKGGDYIDYEVVK